MTIIYNPPVYNTPNVLRKNGNRHDGGNGHSPLPIITGHDIAHLTNSGGDVLDGIAACLVRGEALLGWLMVPQAATVTVRPMQRVYAALRRATKAAAIKGMTPNELDVFVRGNLVAVWDSIERVTA